MKKQLIYILIFNFFCLFTLGCKKDKEEPIDILTSKTWKWSTVDKNPSTNPKGKIVYWEVSNCLLDDVFYFYPNGTYEIKNPDSRCVTQRDGRKSNSYNLSLNEIYYDSDGKYTIAEISKNQIKYYLRLKTEQVPDEKAADFLVFILE